MNARALLRNAKHCLDQANACVDEMQRLRFIRAAQAWRSLARAKRMAEDALLPNEETYERQQAAS